MKKLIVAFLLFLALMAGGALYLPKGRSLPVIWLWQVGGDLVGNNRYAWKESRLPRDLSALSLDDLALLRYGEGVDWAGRGTAVQGFDPAGWIEVGKDPGLGVRELHRRGITGSSVSVAVIDKPIDPGHRELDRRIEYHLVRTRSARGYTYRYHYHGLACATLLAGATCGVAPGARLYYFAIPDESSEYAVALANHILAVERMLEINAALPAEEKIRVVSISHNVAETRDAQAVARWDSVVNRARESGIAVVYSDLKTTHSVFTWGGCPPYLDRANAANYRYARNAGTQVKGYKRKIILPGDFRTFGNNRGGYSYTGNGGWSWALPYFAGLATLGWSVDPSLTMDDIYQLVQQTRYVTDHGIQVVNPVGFIEAVEHRPGRQLFDSGRALHQEPSAIEEQR